MSYFYISFATEEAFLGATVVQGEDPAGAIEEATRQGVNPGGEAMVFPLPSHFNPDDDEHVPFINCLIGQEEMIEHHGGVRLGDMDTDTVEAMQEVGVLFCEEHNKRG